MSFKTLEMFLFILGGMCFFSAGFVFAAIILGMGGE